MKEKLNNRKNPCRKEGRRVLAKSLVGLFLTFFTILMTLGVSLYTFGWFSVNSAVEGNGMSVFATGVSSLLISDDRDAVIHPLGDLSVLFRKTFTSTSPVELEPATHNYESDNADIPQHALKVVDNEDIISPESGLTENDTTAEVFTFKPAVENVHYVDLTTYIGIFGTTLDYTTITLSLDPSGCYVQCEKGFTPQSGVTYYTRSETGFSAATPTDTAVNVYYKQAFDGVYRTVSVDVFYDDEYRGTLLPSGAVTSIELNDEVGTLKPAEPHKVTLRLYFDGNMRDVDGKAILRANNQKLNCVYLSFKYTAE